MMPCLLIVWSGDVGGKEVLETRQVGGNHRIVLLIQKYEDPLVSVYIFFVPVATHNQLPSNSLNGNLHTKILLF